jgi:hypothetical protein
MSISMFRTRSRRVTILVLLACAIGFFGAGAAMQSPRFYPDDPIAREPESQDASKAAPFERSLMFDLMYNLFVTGRSYKPSGLRAKNINTIDEVPDSSWFTNRIGVKPMTTDEITRGPNVGAPPDPSKWVLIREKTAGANPGFTALDAKGETWFVAFDSKDYPEADSAAVAIATRLFWALGYNQVESFITTFDPAKTTIGPEATFRRPNGKRTAFTPDDMESILERVARNPDGTYRVVAGRLLPGKVLGGFLYAGTRPDDPNDVVPHEHRRELRALRVFGAWTNLTDMKNANTIDTLVTENGKTIVKHYLQDVGSTFGMANEKHQWDTGYEYYYDGGASMKRLGTLGFGLSKWQTVDYDTKYPSIGKFEGKEFDPREWRPQTPTTAYMELREDDAFWAARRVAAFTDELIRAAVKTGQFSDPAAEKYLADVLIERRDKIKSSYLTRVNPIVNPKLDAKGLTFENAAVAGGAQNPAGYRASWMLFDNATGATKPLSETKSATTTIAAPAGLPSSGFVAVDIAADSEANPEWKQPVRAFFRNDGGSWKLVGFERLPNEMPSASVEQQR